MLEKQIEADVCAYARNKGILAYKFTSPGHAFVPDRMFLAPGGVMWMCEFKREGQRPTVPQAREHERLRALGFRVFVIDNIPEGRAMVDEMVPRC